MTLLRLQDCLMEEEENSMCDVVDRVFHIDFPVFGLSSLIAQMRFYVWMMEQDNYQPSDNLHPNPRFLATAFRFDLRSGLNKLTNEIRDTAKSTVSTSETVMPILTVAACVIFLVGLFAFARMWVNMLIQTNEESEKLMDLLPISSDEREMELLPSMLTGYQPMDQARQKIIEAALTVLESIAKNDKKEELATNLDFLMIATTQAFTEEENEMLKRDYEHTEHHTREHLLIRQRLTHISDEMKKKDTASVRIAIRHLIRLFDKHFTDDDVQYGNIIPAEEKTTMQNEQRNEEWEEAEDVGELGEPGQVEGL
ncbi:hypothetical protein BLNAU_19314 [Blattamonas nauphoetae]|uniref:Hemerythrin-like domain-containing protein n=1 Tax=Blattamonas nauphoetae TaxID=2049346 RepID=A0ABQ9X1V9_9EUKA|nr:hypothetical protein BLNAU_19314 [Blattamonas nauphoetae]